MSAQNSPGGFPNTAHSIFKLGSLWLFLTFHCPPMLYFKKSATGGDARTTFGAEVGNFLIKKCKYKFWFFEQILNGPICWRQVNSESNGISSSKCVHKYGTQDAKSELKKTDCFAPLRPSFFCELRDVQKVAFNISRQIKCCLPHQNRMVFF